MEYLENESDLENIKIDFESLDEHEPRNDFNSFKEYVDDYIKKEILNNDSTNADPNIFKKPTGKKLSYLKPKIEKIDFDEYKNNDLQMQYVDSKPYQLNQNVNKPIKEGKEEDLRNLDLWNDELERKQKIIQEAPNNIFAKNDEINIDDIQIEAEKNNSYDVVFDQDVYVEKMLNKKNKKTKEKNIFIEPVVTIVKNILNNTKYPSDFKLHKEKKSTQEELLEYKNENNFNFYNESKEQQLEKRKNDLMYLKKQDVKQEKKITKSFDEELIDLISDKTKKE